MTRRSWRLFDAASPWTLLPCAGATVRMAGGDLTQDEVTRLVAIAFGCRRVTR